MQEVRGKVSGLLWVSGKKPKTAELVDGGILEKTELRICDAAAGDYLHIDLNALAGIGAYRDKIAKLLRAWAGDELSFKKHGAVKRKEEKRCGYMTIT